MGGVANCVGAGGPRQGAWLAVARGLVAGDGPGIRALGSAISAPLACVVAGAALASIASSDGVDDTWTRITAQSFIPVDAKDIDSNQFYVRQVGLSQLALGDHIADGFTPDPDKLREELACLARNIYLNRKSTRLNSSH